MSETEDSITRSNSEESFFSSDSSSEQCLRPGRLMELIAEKFRLMRCMNREHQQPATTAFQVVMSDQAEVTNPDQPSCSSSISTSSNLIVELLDVDFHVQSGSGAPPLSSSTNAAQETILKGNLVDMMVTEQENSIFVLNFPGNVIVDGNETSQPKVGECASPVTAGKREVRFYDTGRFAVAFGEREFETVTVAEEPQHDQELVRIERDATTQRSTMTSLGVVQHFLDVLPPVTEDIVDVGVDENKDSAKQA